MLDSQFTRAGRKGRDILTPGKSDHNRTTNNDHGVMNRNGRPNYWMLSHRTRINTKSRNSESTNSPLKIDRLPFFRAFDISFFRDEIPSTESPAEDGNLIR